MEKSGGVEPGETIEQATVRETVEEIGVTPSQLEKVAAVTFLFPLSENFAKWNQQVHVYTSHRWTDEIVESDEIDPKWFKTSEIPYDFMYPDAPYWLPQILDGNILTAEFLYGADWQILDYTVKVGTHT